MFFKKNRNNLKLILSFQKRTQSWIVCHFLFFPHSKTLLNHFCSYESMPHTRRKNQIAVAVVDCCIDDVKLLFDDDCGGGGGCCCSTGGTFAVLMILVIEEAVVLLTPLLSVVSCSSNDDDDSGIWFDTLNAVWDVGVVGGVVVVVVMLFFEFFNCCK